LIAKRNLNNGMAHVSEKIVLRCTTAGWEEKTILIIPVQNNQMALLKRISFLKHLQTELRSETQ
jgi:hypothetical protein